MSIEKAIEFVLGEVKGAAIRKLTEFPDIKVSVIDSQCLVMNRIIGRGGWPKGHMVELYGNENTGKTTLCYHAIAQAQKEKLVCAFIDAEHRVDPTYAQKIGVDPSKLIFMQPNSGEECMEVIKSLLKSQKVDLIIVDSVDAIRPSEEDDGKMGDANVGRHAKLINQGVRQFSKIKGKCCVIFTNQIRENPGKMFGNPEYQPGGRALKFYCSLRIELRKGDTQTEGDEKIGNAVRVKCVKNSVAPPFREGEFRIVYGSGVDKIHDVFTAAVKSGLITKKGSYYSLNIDGKETKIGQGEANVLIWLKEKDRAAKLREFVKRSGFYLENESPPKPDQQEEQDEDGDIQEDGGLGEIEI